MKKYLGLLASVLLMLSSCMSMGKMVPQGQTANSESCYLVGRVMMDLPEESTPPEKMDYMSLVFEGISGEMEGKGIFKDVPRNDDFYIELPKGEYRLRTISYMTMVPLTSNAITIGSSSELAVGNIHTINGNLDLRSSQMSYIGDIHIGQRKNAYGITENAIAVKNNYDHMVSLSEGWLMDQGGMSVTPDNLSSQLSTAYILTDPYNRMLFNRNFKFPKAINLQTIDGEKFSLENGKSVAILPIDNDYSSWIVSGEMEQYAADKYNANVLYSSEFTSKIPQYPAYMYTGHDSEATIEDLYSTDLSDLYVTIGVSLGVDYLYTVNKVVGYTASYSRGKKTQEGVMLRSSLFDVNKGEIIAVAQKGISKKEQGLLGSVVSSESHEDKLFRDLSESLIDQLYK
ncbi:MAG: hypothetical protein PQJ50_01630 [Spirochaetales bacterium]|nr:hypothetical protein [Spirochaetales bacterium]